jgi:hypothetical protein
MKKANNVPADKFKVDNCIRYAEYIQEVKKISPWRMKFVDEKSLKGAELFTKKSRVDPLTGLIDNRLVPSDFRNTYSIIGICGIDPQVSAMFFRMYQHSIASKEFGLFLEYAVGIGWLLRGDVLVADNAKIHFHGDNKDLEDFMWECPSPHDGLPLNIKVILLPTRSPELNPIELVWADMVKKLEQTSD